MDRRSFIKLIATAPAIGCISTIVSNKKDKKSEVPKALIVDPYLVNLKDLREANFPGRIIRLRRPAWGTGEPIRRIF